MRRSLLLVSSLVLTGVLSATVAAAAPASDSLVRVTATRETPSNFDDDAGGGADTDDPAIWVNRRDLAASRVIATVKDSGLRVYDLAGREVQTVAPPPGGRFNNVDILRDMSLGGRTVDVAVTTDRGLDRLRTYVIDPASGVLTDVTAPDAPLAFSASAAEATGQATAYGLAVFRGIDGQPYAVATRRHTPTIGLFHLEVRDGRVTYRRTDTFSFPTRFPVPGGIWSPCEDPGEGPQLEGLVVDPTTRVLYAAQEDVALWRLPVVGPRLVPAPQTVERTTTFGVPATYDPASESCRVTGPDPHVGGRIVADVEGLTIYPTGPSAGTLLVSSQGDDTFYTYDRVTGAPRIHFAITDGTVDGTQDTDGATVDPTPLPGFPRGLLVTQDGRNTPDVPDDGGAPRVDTNLKYVDASVLLRRPGG